MSVTDSQIRRIKYEEQIKYLIDLRKRFCQYLKQNFNTIWYSDVQNYFTEDCQYLGIVLIDCVSDLVHINQLLSNEAHDDFLLELKCKKSFNLNDISKTKLDDTIKRIYFNRRYRALINSREILLDDISQNLDEDFENRMIKIRAICVLDEEIDHLQEDFSLKSFEEQVAIRLQQIRAMINVYFKQAFNSSHDDQTSSLIPLIHSCDSFLSTFRLFLDIPSSDISFNSLSDI